MLKIGILISGRGSNMKALLEAARDPAHPYRAAVVIVNKLDAPGIAVARTYGVPVEVINHRTYGTREAFERELDMKLREYGVELVCLAGFMRLLTPWFIERWFDKTVNIHPSLLPAFPGTDTHKKAIEAGVKFSGTTVHFARNEMDSGPIIAQAVVPVMTDDNPETLAARILEAEHIIYPLAVRLIAEGRVNVFENTLFITGASAPSTVLVSPLVDLPLAKAKQAP